ncbi:MAG: hypothetical protein HDS82_03635 [Bacteroidales bacterium]|nr:hypothetical protein [Bacteroidales bacterium]
MNKDNMGCAERTTGLRPMANLVLLASVLCIVVFLAGCEGKGSHAAEGSESADYYHADNDIAMVVRSLADAVSVGEPLDSVDYDYDGILTDGQGTPLYTDVQGAPGQWEVNVVSPHRAVIRNLYLGDLLPGDLEAYITGSLNLTDADLVETHEYDSDDESDLALYSIPGGELRFETRAGIAPNGLEGPLMSIVIAARQ